MLVPENATRVRVEASISLPVAGVTFEKAVATAEVRLAPAESGK